MLVDDIDLGAGEDHPHDTTMGSQENDTVSKKIVPQKVKFHMSGKLLLK